jgi:alkanesulfonate monooxygenase SsuD/methylene tetrahydromethanopterin reductase-like flavin-dependent oxidoreductase (luciferase family)
MRHAMYLAPFGELADPRALAEVAVAAESGGWDGVFLWDHMWRPPERAPQVGDAWTSLAAIACATRSIRLGPMIVPLARRRPQKVARESVALDLLSDGRLTLGVGLGGDANGELARFDEVVDPRARASLLDEALDVLQRLWTTEPVRHHGAHFTVDDVAFLPGPVQAPRIPIWGASWGGSGPRPIRRAARLDGIFPWSTTPQQLREALAIVARLRGTLDGFDVAIVATSPQEAAEMTDVGATWLIRALPEVAPIGTAIAVATAGPEAW